MNGVDKIEIIMEDKPVAQLQAAREDRNHHPFEP